MTIAAFSDKERVARETLARLERQMWERTCRRDLTAYAREVLRPVEHVPAKHHRLLLHHLQLVKEGKIKRLMVTMPPGSAKSTYCSVIFPPWVHQTARFNTIATSHGSGLAEDFSRAVQSTIEQTPSILQYGLRTKNVERWSTTNGGFYRAAGVGGSITGRRADGGIIDDPVKGTAEAESATMREATWRWYESDFYTRLKPEAWIIVIMTRWNEDDLGGRLLQKANDGGDKWTVLRLPAISDSADDPLGRPLGAALWPEWQDEIALLGGVRENGEQVAGVRKNVGEYVWGSLYQQDPKPRGASFFDIDAMMRNTGVLGPTGMPMLEPWPMPDRCDIVFSTVDTAIKSGQQHNSTAVMHWAYNTLIHPQVYLLDWDLVQIEGSQQAGWLPSVFARGEELARECGARQGYQGAMIEDKATGTVLLQQARVNQWPAHAIDSKLTAMGKEERALSAQPHVIAGDVGITDYAFHKTKVHKGRSANHALVQVTGFRLGSKETDGLDLLDTYCYGVILSRGSEAGPKKGYM